jgi:hypothetical protein
MAVDPRRRTIAEAVGVARTSGEHEQRFYKLTQIARNPREQFHAVVVRHRLGKRVGSTCIGIFQLRSNLLKYFIFILYTATL